MTPSNANTSGLAVVAWRYRTAPHRDWHETECSEVARVEEMDGSEVEPLHVTAASAQARIDAEKARADRLAKMLETLEAERKREGVNLAHLKRAVAVAYADMNRAALQQETQP